MCWQKHWQQQKENREGQFNVFHTPSVCFMSTAISLKFIEGPQSNWGPNSTEIHRKWHLFHTIILKTHAGFVLHFDILLKQLHKPASKESYTW